MKTARIAILIDGSFFLRRLPKLVAPRRRDSPVAVVACIRHLCRNHVKALTGDDDSRWHKHVHRIFYYDALPYDGKEHHPLNDRPLDFSKSDIAARRHAIFDLLRRERKLALRLGKVNKESDWTIAPKLTKRLLRTRQQVAPLDRLGGAEDAEAMSSPMTVELSPDEVRELTTMRDQWRALEHGHVSLGLRQKGVDMRIGLDISNLTIKKQVNTIVLVAGDSDFVPAAKHARREGVEFILDPLWQTVNADLFEHIDGLQSGLPRPDSIGPRELSAPAAESPASEGDEPTDD